MSEETKPVDPMLDPEVLRKAQALFKAQMDYFSAPSEVQSAIQSYSGLGHSANTAGRARVLEIVTMILTGLEAKEITK